MTTANFSLFEQSAPLAKVRAAQEALPHSRRCEQADHLAAEIAAKLAAAGIAQQADNYGDSGPDLEALESLRRDGLVRLGPLLDVAQVAELRAWFDHRQVYLGHVETQSRGFASHVDAAREAGHRYAGYPLTEVLRAPHLLELALSPRLIALAAAYLGCTPSLYSFNVWWSFPSLEEAAGPLQIFHRDEDDFRFLSVFVPLVDVDSGNGPHEYVLGTHRAGALPALHREIKARLLAEGGEAAVAAMEDQLFDADSNGAAVNAYFGERVVRLTAKAGDGVMEDVSGYHRGGPVAARPRLMAWFRYGLYANCAYRNDGHRPIPYREVAGRIPRDLRHRYIARLLIDPEE